MRRPPQVTLGSLRSTVVRLVTALMDAKVASSRLWLGATADPAPAPVVICAWCPDFNPFDRANANVTHGMCTACAAKFDEQRRRVA